MNPELILFEDEDVLVINKPNGLVVNNSQTAKETTLQGMLLDYLAIPADDSEFCNRGGIVHRLDKDTSGIVLVSKNVDAFDYLKDQFKQRLVEKHYYGVVVGDFTSASIEINAPIKRNPSNRLRFAVVEDGKEAVTTAKKIKTLDGYTSMDITPKTGRTHQIRVHFAAMGYPIAGDRLYCSRFNFAASIDYFDRMMLHAYSLTFNHPRSKTPFTIDCLPEEKIWQSFIPHA